MKCKIRLCIILFVILVVALFVVFVLYSGQENVNNVRHKHAKRKPRHRAKKARKIKRVQLQEKRVSKRLITSTNSQQIHDQQPRHYPGQINEKGNPLEVTGKFCEVAKDTHVYSAFYDKTTSPPCVRMIILSGQHYQPKLFCQFCEPYAPSCTFSETEARFYTPNENHGRLFGGFIASCDIPEGFDGVPLYIDITADVKGQKTSKVRVPVVSNANLQTKPYEYTICVPPLREGKRDRLVEFIELTRLLGANHLTFYEFQIGQESTQVLQLYIKLGFVDILPWNLPSSLVSQPNDIWYFGQVLAVLDCLYRYKHRAKFVSFNDLDEFIVPLQNGSVPELLKSIHKPQHCGHCFQSVVFSLNARFPRQRSRLLSQKYFHRTRETLALLSKCIVDPLRVFEMGIHHISKATGQQYSVNLVHESEALIFHYRTCTMSFGIRHQCMELLHDGTMTKYGKQLTTNFNEIINELEGPMTS